MDWSQVRIPGIDESTVAIVLGGGGAIGGETVRAFAAMGANVALVTRTAEQGVKAAAEIAGPGKVLPVTADLADSASLVRMVAEVQAQLGTPTVMVNSAALGVPKADLNDVSREDLTSLFDVNVIGAAEAIKAVAPAMREAGYGRIVNVASVAAQRALTGSSPYAASKAAMISFTRNLAVDLGPSGITVNAVSPGQTPTALRRLDETPGTPQGEASGAPADAIPLRRRGELADYTGAILFLSSALSAYITGVDLAVEGGGLLVRASSYK